MNEAATTPETSGRPDTAMCSRPHTSEETLALMVGQVVTLARPVDSIAVRTGDAIVRRPAGDGVRLSAPDRLMLDGATGLSVRGRIPRGATVRVRYSDQKETPSHA